MQIVHTVNEQAQSEYKHALANILRSLFVVRTPPVEARAVHTTNMKKIYIAPNSLIKRDRGAGWSDRW